MSAIEVYYGPQAKPTITLWDKIRSGSEAIFSMLQSPERQGRLELDASNYTLDADLSIEQKLQKGWTIENDVVFEEKNGNHKLIPMLTAHITTKYGSGKIIEYIADEQGIVPAKLIGQQLFNKNALQALGLTQQLPTYEELQLIKDRQVNHGYFLKQHFKQDGENMFPGYRDYCDGEHIKDTDKSMVCRVGLKNGGKGKIVNVSGAEITEQYITYKQVHSGEFLSVRLLKK